MTLLDRLIAIRTGGAVERCHGIWHQGSYSVAAHSWGVAMLMLLLWPQDFRRLAIYCLVHDVPEAWVGDIPAPTKKYLPEVKRACDDIERQIFDRLDLPNDADLSVLDRAKLRACDHLELYVWATEQINGGNGHARCIRRELDSFFKHEPLLLEAQTLYGAIRYGNIELATDKLLYELTKERSDEANTARSVR